MSRNSSSLIIFIFLCLIQFGCDSQAAKNRNANIVQNYNKAINKSLGNANQTNINQANAIGNVENQNEEVPKFENAAELQTYGDHPMHQAFIVERWLTEVRDFQEADFEAL